MDIAVIGASGDVGRQIVQHIVVERLLQCERRLVLVGNAAGASARSIHGLAADLIDAYAEICPRIEVVLDPEELQADLIVMAAGATLPVDPNADGGTRDELADRNAPVSERYAQALARNGRGSEIVVCITNPNELAVALFAKHLGRRRVIGMGAFLDSLRFRKELAHDLGVPRQAVHAHVAGEHGPGIVPLWSDIHVYGVPADRLSRDLARIRGDGAPVLAESVSRALRETRELVAAGRVPEAYAAVDRYPPDVRVVVRPFVTHFSGAKTVIGTARATMEFLRTITQGSDVLVAGQIALDGEAYGIRSTIGVPFVVGNQGVDRVFELPLSDEERESLCDSAARVQQKIARFL